MKRKKRIVFTGGPSGGKTSIIEIVKRHFGDKIAVVPEAATILYGGGFPRARGPETMRHVQRAIYYVVRELEDITDETGKASIAICDRGTLDGMAYWPETGPGFLESMGTTREEEFKRYAVVIHLRSLKAERSYRSSDSRIESHAQALELDKRIENVWKGHPNRFVIEEEPDFLLKINRVMEVLELEMERLL